MSDMVERIADMLVDDHITLLRENERLRGEVERLTDERDAAVKAMSGWSGCCYRDGYYVDDIGEYFQPFIDAARGEK